MENPSINLLKYRSFPDLAAALRSRIDNILERLQAAVKEALPSADELTFVELRDHLPETLEQLARALEATTAAPTRLFLTDFKEHGVCRYHQSFNLRELLIEYSLIRSLLVEEVSSALNRPLRLEEIMTLNVGIDAATRRAVTAFVTYQDQEVQASAEAQSKYLSFLSHDLRGGLNGILLTVEVLKRELGASSQYKASLEDLDMIRRSILETVGTMDRFLHAEKFRKGKIEVKLNHVNLATLMPEVIGQFSQQAAQKGVGVHIDSSRCPQLVSDRELLALILQNLIGNAVKYSDRGAVSVVSEPLKDGGCRITVADEGKGIAADKIATLFQPFTRGETHGQSGVGLGLSMAKQAAELLKAKLWVRSEPGKGSTFYLDLPPNPEP